MSTQVEIISSQDDLGELTRLRYEIFVHGMGKEVRDADHGHRVVTDALDSISSNFVVRKDGRILGALRVTDANDLAALSKEFAEHEEVFALQPFMDNSQGRICFTSRLMISPELRGSTSLWRLLSEAFRKAMNDGTYFDFCMAPPGMAQLYAQLGYRRYKSNILYQSLGYDIPMVQVTRDVRHLEVCGSPFLKVAQEAVEGQRCKEVEWFLESYGEALQTYDLQSLDPGRALEETALLALESSGENIFSGLSREELNQLRGHAYPLKFEAGDHIIRKEERREEMFIVEEGSVSVERGSPGLKPIVLGRGQVFGEVSLLTATGRTADVIAVEDGRILVLTRQTVIRLMKKKPELMSTLLFNIGRILAGRFVEINDTLNKESNHG